MMVAARGIEASRRILALVSGLPPRKRYSRIIVMLQAFFDGSTETNSALILAGYIGSVDTWLRFSAEWGEMLELRPRIRRFKMSELYGDGMLERAMFHYRIADKYPIFGIGCAIPLAPLYKVVAELNIPPMWENPYYFAWRVVVTLSLEGAKLLGLIDPMEFIFDTQSDKVNVIKSWDNYYESVPIITRQKLRGPPSFKNDEDVMPLQAADMIAWWARRQYIKDKLRMRDLFPIEWTGGKEPSLLFAEVPEEGIRTQFLKDIAATQRQRPRMSAHASLIRGVPWKS